MKKNIDIRDDIVPDLQYMAAKEKKDLKNWIQDILIKKAR